MQRRRRGGRRSKRLLRVQKFLEPGQLVDAAQLDYVEKLTLEKKRQQLQRELELELQKERLLHENGTVTKNVCGNPACPLVSHSVRSNCRPMQRRRRRVRRSKRLLRVQKFLERGQLVDAAQLDYVEEFTLEKKRQQLQRELDLELQKERLLHENGTVTKTVSGNPTCPLVSHSVRSNCRPIQRRRRRVRRSKRLLRVQKFLEPGQLVDAAQFDYVEAFTLEKKKQQLQRELELELQKERFLQENVTVTKTFWSQTNNFRMATPILTKIVLKNTTKMSLNERFTAYRAEAQSAVNTYRQKIQMQRQASSANLRLAQQMANRPTVIAALRLKKRSLQQRLGRRQQSASNVKARLSLNVKSRLANNPLQMRLGTFRGRGAGRRGGFKPGTSPLLKARLGTQRSFNYASPPNQRLGFRKRGNFQGGNRQGRGGNRLQTSRNVRGGRNNRGGGGGGRGRGGRLGKARWGKEANAVLPTKQELDNQLDEYMAETKGSLDAQLGHYMSQN